MICVNVKLEALSELEFRKVCLDYPATVAALVEYLKKSLDLEGSEGQFSHYAVALNGRIFPLREALPLKLEDGDQVIFVAPLAGGASFNASESLLARGCFLVT